MKNLLYLINRRTLCEKIKLTQIKSPPKLSQNEFKERIKNIGSIIKIENALEEKENKKIR
jgi:hypothetical protein